MKSGILAVFNFPPIPSERLIRSCCVFWEMSLERISKKVQGKFAVRSLVSGVRSEEWATSTSSSTLLLPCSSESEAPNETKFFQRIVPSSA